MNDTNNILLTPKEAKAFLRTSIPTLNKRVEEGVFRKYKFPNSKRVYYKKQELIDALEVLDPKEQTRDKLIKTLLKYDKLSKD